MYTQSLTKRSLKKKHVVLMLSAIVLLGLAFFWDRTILAAMGCNLESSPGAPIIVPVIDPRPSCTVKVAQRLNLKHLCKQAGAKSGECYAGFAIVDRNPADCDALVGPGKAQCLEFLGIATNDRNLCNQARALGGGTNFCRTILNTQEAIEEKDYSLCGGIDTCIGHVAVALGDASICEAIKGSPYYSRCTAKVLGATQGTEGCLAKIDSRISTGNAGLYDSPYTLCFTAAADKAGDPTLCLPDIQADGIRIDESSCIRAVASKHKDPSFCQSARGASAGAKKASCIEHVAVTHSDISMCDEVSKISCGPVCEKRKWQDSCESEVGFSKFTADRTLYLF